MPLSSTLAQPSPLRLVLRASLLGGAVLDAALALLLALAVAGWADDSAIVARFFSAAVSSVATSYPWLAAPALLARAAVQFSACYDRRRYDALIAPLGLSLAATALAALAAPVPGALAVLYLALGAGQLISWRLTRR